jgi:outer membrane protein OmpA-like peptidoglycan-associated protein
MGSKLILLLSVLVGAFLTFMCVNENKTALSAKYSQVTNTQQMVKTPVIPRLTEETRAKEVGELREPSFAYDIKNGIKLNAKFLEKDRNPNIQNFISKYCEKESCQKNISYKNDIKIATWQNDIIKIATFLKENDVKGGLISIDGKLLNIEGELKSQEEMAKLNELLTPFSPEVYKMENLTKVSQKIEVVSIPEDPTPTKQEIQSQITALLSTNPIYFENASAIIKTKGKITLDKIIQKLKTFDQIELKVDGHTDAVGKASYNKQLSQKRAEAVKKYLLKSLKNTNIKAIGYGETKPTSKNPRDKINRRVEIYLKGGK